MRHEDLLAAASSGLLVIPVPNSTSFELNGRVLRFGTLLSNEERAARIALLLAMQPPKPPETPGPTDRVARP